MPIKNVAVCVALHARLASLAPPCPLGSKKVAQLPPFSTTLVVPDPGDAASTTLELDELWSFVLKKVNQVWVWIALCRKTRQVVAYALGDRSKQTCQRLWEAIPSAYRQGHCFTDFRAAYSAVIPDEQHTALGPRDGRNRPCGALEQYPPSTLGSLCPHDLVFFKVGDHARGVFAPLSSPL
jgi:IS1 family transposase